MHTLPPPALEPLVLSPPLRLRLPPAPLLLPPTPTLTAPPMPAADAPLLTLTPPGTPDPSPFLYNDVFKGLAAASAVALACNVAAFRLPIVRR